MPFLCIYYLDVAVNALIGLNRVEIDKLKSNASITHINALKS